MAGPSVLHNVLIIRSPAFAASEPYDSNTDCGASKNTLGCNKRNTFLRQHERWNIERWNIFAPNTNDAGLLRQRQSRLFVDLQHATTGEDHGFETPERSRRTKPNNVREGRRKKTNNGGWPTKPERTNARENSKTDVWRILVVVPATVAGRGRAPPSSR